MSVRFYFICLPYKVMHAHYIIRQLWYRKYRSLQWNYKSINIDSYQTGPGLLEAVMFQIVPLIQDRRTVFPLCFGALGFFYIFFHEKYIHLFSEVSRCEELGNNEELFALPCKIVPAPGNPACCSSLTPALASC